MTINIRFQKQILSTPGCDEPQPQDDDDHDRPYPRPNIDPIRDPSGIVYEGVMSMLIEGVKATIYQSNSANASDMGQVWNAEVYGQTNPLLTDGQGMYAWDVPRGNFKVVFEKEGYETTSTEWLPVPPPQLDVNVSMRKTTPATLKAANAHLDEVTVEFDTYMNAATLIPTNIYLEDGGQRIEATIELTNAVNETSGTQLASKLRIVPSAPFTDDCVTLVIKSGTATYADVTLPTDIRRVLPVEDRITSLVAPEVFKIAYGENAALRVLALPAEAVAGKTLNVTSSSTQMIDVDATEVEFDADGYATVNVSGLLPGNAALMFAVEGYDSTVTTRIVVGSASASDVAAPEASIPSGTQVEVGTTISLYSPTPDAVIYYTLDGSCPCDPNAKREVYDTNHPIVITESVKIRAMAVKDGMESEIATFNYTVVSTGINENSVDGGIKIYPTPVKDILYVDVPEADKFSLVLTNTAGMTVMKQSFLGSRATVDVSEMPSGIYILTLNFGHSEKSYKVIKL